MSSFHKILGFIRRQCASHKGILSLLILAAIAIIVLYVFIRIQIGLLLTQQVATVLQERLISAGIPPRIIIGRESVRSDTLLIRFYVNRAFKPAWISNNGPTTMADSLLSNIRLATHEGLKPEQYHMDAISARLDSVRAHVDDKRPLNLAELSDLDILLTDAFLVYGSHLLSGRIDPETVDPEWVAKYPEADITVVLQRALEQEDLSQTLLDLVPSFDYYQRLRDELGRYRSIAWRGGWPIVPEGPTLEMDDTGYRVAALRARLMVSGDFTPQTLEEDAVYDSLLGDAVLRFQKRHNLQEDGAVGYATRLAMNVPALHYVRRLAANMERWRWLPKDLGDRYILVNIASFELRVVEKGETVLSMRVVVGKDYRQTPVFSGLMTHLVLNPYWNVPKTISHEDILPQVQKDTGYLKERNIEVFTGWSSQNAIDPDSVQWDTLTPENLPYRFRQAPGVQNALGRIKFMFPNKYDVYLHDTPYRTHFAKRERAYSSGCIRLEDPIALAEYILKSDSTWTRERIEKMLDGDENRTINLDQDIPVYIFYATAWPHEDGTIHYLKDIYDRDAILENAMRREAFLPF